MRGVTFGNNTYNFVTVGSWVDTSNAVHTFTMVSSDNGNSWTTGPASPMSVPLSSVAYSNGVFVAVGALGTILSSTDGYNWNRRNSGTVENLAGVTSGDGTFVAAGDSGALLTSTDGTKWMARSPAIANVPHLNGICYGYGTFTATGTAGAIIQSQTLEGIGPESHHGTPAKRHADHGHSQLRGQSQRRRDHRLF